MSLVSDIYNQSFIDLGVIRPGETISATLGADALAQLIQLWALRTLDQTLTYAWYHDGGLVLVAGTDAYTVGTGGSLVTTAAPIRITGWTCKSGGFQNAGKPVSFEQFDAEVKDPLATSSKLISILAADGQVPTKNIRVFPVPAASPGTLTLDYFGPMVQISTAGQSLSFGPGYEYFMRKDLAVAMYPAYARSGALTIQTLTSQRDGAMALIQQNNAAIQQLGASAPPAQAA